MWPTPSATNSTVELDARHCSLRQIRATQYKALQSTDLIIPGIITPIGGRPVHRTAIYRCDDTRGCIVQFLPS